MLKDYKGSAASEAGEAFVATVDNIEKRTAREELPGGLKLALLPKKTKGGQVRLALTVRFGSEADLKGKVEAASLLPEMLLRGTRKHSFEQLKDKLDLLKAEVSFGHGHGSPSTVNVAQVHVKTVRENLAAVIALLGEMLREPAFGKKGLRIPARRDAVQAGRAAFRSHRQRQRGCSCSACCPSRPTTFATRPRVKESPSSACAR
jgi:zinc protease